MHLTSTSAVVYTKCTKCRFFSEPSSMCAMRRSRYRTPASSCSVTFSVCEQRSVISARVRWLPPRTPDRKWVWGAHLLFVASKAVGAGRVWAHSGHAFGNLLSRGPWPCGAPGRASGDPIPVVNAFWALTLVSRRAAGSCLSLLPDSFREGTPLWSSVALCQASRCHTWTVRGQGEARKAATVGTVPTPL